MKEYLYPDVYVESILDLPLGKLYQYGIRAFIMDLDNTVTEWNSCEVRDEVVAWMQEVKDRGFKAVSPPTTAANGWLQLLKGWEYHLCPKPANRAAGLSSGFAGNGQRGG